MWQRWLTKDGDLFQGTYELSGERLVLTGAVQGEAEPLRLELVRMAVAGSR